MLDLWLVRHAESVGNVARTEADTPLSVRGRDQATALASALEAERFDAVYVSPLARAGETVMLACPGRIPLVDARLTEFLPPAAPRVLDLSAMSAAQLHALLVSTPPAHGETGLQFKRRIAAFVGDLPSAGRVLVVSHFAVMRELLGVYLGFASSPQVIAHTGIFRLAIDPTGGPRRLLWNDTSRLSASL